jgi:hypothetical protein
MEEFRAVIEKGDPYVDSEFPPVVKSLYCEVEDAERVTG